MQACITLARSIAAVEEVGEWLVSFHTLDLLVHESALALICKHVDQAVDQAKTRTEVTTLVIFLYVYPTLLARLDALVDALAGRFSSLLQEVKVVTLTYHFALDAPRRLVRRNETGDGRFVVYVLL